MEKGLKSGLKPPDDQMPQLNGLSRTTLTSVPAPNYIDTSDKKVWLLSKHARVSQNGDWEGITNVYIRGFLPETTDEMLHAYAARFGKIERCKAIVDLDTSLCKGYLLHETPFQ